MTEETMPVFPGLAVGATAIYAESEELPGFAERYVIANDSGKLHEQFGLKVFPGTLQPCLVEFATNLAVILEAKQEIPDV